MSANARGKRILILDPSPKGVSGGNRVTALRWALILRELGARVRVRSRLDQTGYDLLIALHAVKNAASVVQWRRQRGSAPLVVALTGTDFQAGSDRATALASLAAADRVVELFEGAHRSAFESVGDKVVTIPQSFASCVTPLPSTAEGIVFSLLANLRPVKDPMLATRALARLPHLSQLRLVIVGGVLDQDIAQQIRDAQRTDPRIEWVGPQRRRKALELLAASHVLLCTSNHEGGAGTVAEAMAMDRAVLSTDLPACRALLGGDHPGFFQVGDDRGLAQLMERFASDSSYREQLRACSRSHAHLVQRDLERQRWRALINDLPFGVAKPRPAPS